MITYADLVIRIAQALFGRKDRLQDIKRDSADRVAAYMDQVADLLTNISTALRRGETPTIDCAQLGLTGTLIMDMESDQLGLPELRELSNLIGEADALPLSLIQMLCDRPNGFLINVDNATDARDEIYLGAFEQARHDTARPVSNEVEAELRKLEAAAGTFKAVGAYIRAVPNIK